MRPDVGALRIGEFARRVDVSTELLRAWERRWPAAANPHGGSVPALYHRGRRPRRAHEAGLGEGLSAAEAARKSARRGTSGGWPPGQCVDPALDMHEARIARVRAEFSASRLRTGQLSRCSVSISGNTRQPRRPEHSTFVTSPVGRMRPTEKRVATATTRTGRKTPAGRSRPFAVLRRPSPAQRDFSRCFASCAPKWRRRESNPRKMPAKREPAASPS